MSAAVPALLVHATAAGTPVVSGCPVPADHAERYLAGTVVQGATGAAVPAQVVALSPETAGHLRWLEFSFLSPEGEAGPVTLAPSAADGRAPLGALTATGAALCNPHLAMRLLTSGPAPLVVEHAGVVLGQLAPELVTEQGIVHREAPGATRQVRLLRQGPLRTQAEVSGQLQHHDGQPSFHYRLTVELWANQPTCRIDWLLAHQVPGVAAFTVERATLVGHWQVGDQPLRRFFQLHHGAYYKPREVLNPAPVALLTDESCGPVHVADPAMLLDDEHYAHYLQAPTINAGDWLVLQGSRAAVAAKVVDMAATRPNQLRSEGSDLSYDFIPGGYPTTWPQGRRREQTLLLTVAGPAGLPGRAELPGRLAGAWTPGRAQPAPAWLAATQAFGLQHALPYVPGRNVRFTQLFRRLCQLDTPGEKFNLGDTIDQHYTLTYATVPNRFAWLPNAPELPRHYDTGGHLLQPDSLGQLIEPVWTNNEYDIVHALALEVMRTGKADYAAMLRWFSRHTVEVDFVAYNDDRWHHRAQPAHSAHHHTTGAYPSHFWTQGLLQYYVLSGDRDVEEVCLALGDKILENNHEPTMRSWGFDRELGWGLLSLVCLLELGYTHYRAEADEIAQFLMDFDRAKYRGAVNLSAGRAGRSLERQMIDNGFGYSSMVEAMDRYQQVTGRADTAAWLEALLQQLKEEAWNAIAEGESPGLRSMVTQMLAIGYERTGDADFIHVGMALVDGFFEGLALGADTSWGQTKPNAMLYRAMYRFLGHADRLDLLDRFELPAVRERRAARG